MTTRKQPGAVAVPHAQITAAHHGGAAPQQPRRARWSPTLRMVVGALLVVLASAVVVVALIRGEIVTLRTAINQNPSLSVAPGTLASASAGAPQTLLLVGDDRRALTRYYHHAVPSHSNEMLLIRFDSSKPWISMLSIPRELWVTIRPRNGPPVTNRINYAYTLGGTQLMTETIKRVLGLAVNHVIVVDFGHFKRAVDELGCVYSTIDRRYYHSNVNSLEQYQEINLQPGYQRLCGRQALEFVSYRHGDTSLIRDARNQSFMLDVKKQFSSALASDPHKFERIFGQAVQTDPALHSTQGLLDLVTLLIQSAGRPVRQVHFQANLLATYDTATPAQINATVDQFLNGNPVPPKHRTAVLARRLGRRRTIAGLGLIPTPSSALAQAQASAPGLPFGLEYPRLREQFAGADPDYLHIYSIRDPNGVLHRAYVVVVSRGLVGQYYDVQGTNWTNAPMFDRPEQSVRVGARTYYLYYEGSSLRMVAWYEGGAVYWVRNTLTDDVPNADMLAIAEQSQQVGTPGPAPPGTSSEPVAISPLQRPITHPASSSLQIFGAVAGLIAFLITVGMAVRLLARRRELVALREQVASALAVDARARAVAAELSPPIYRQSGRP